MAKNDTVLIDSILQQRVADSLPSNKLDEVFEFFALEQLLKDFDLSRDELERGWIDGRDDGGVDALFIFINGNLLTDPENFGWPKSGALMEIWIVTCKHHSTFEQAPIDAILASAQELFDLSLKNDELKGNYSDELLQVRDLLMLAYRRLAIAKPKITFKICYVSRGTAMKSEVAYRQDRRSYENWSARFSAIRRLNSTLWGPLNWYVCSDEPNSLHLICLSSNTYRLG
jgi:hypothetical protein